MEASRTDRTAAVGGGAAACFVAALLQIACSIVLPELAIGPSPASGAKETPHLTPDLNQEYLPVDIDRRRSWAIYSRALLIF
jgi:hypothetical protein